VNVSSEIVLPKPFKLVLAWLSAASKVSGHPATAAGIDFVLKSLALQGLRPDDALAQALRKIAADVDADTRQSFSAEFGADWKDCPDLKATIAALPAILDRYSPTVETIAENLDPVLVAEHVVKAANDAREDLFQLGTVGASMLTRVVQQACIVAMRNKDFTPALVLRSQQILRDRVIKIESRLETFVESVRFQPALNLPSLAPPRRRALYVLPTRFA
jgi:hypothetical protein